MPRKKQTDPRALKRKYRPHKKLAVTFEFMHAVHAKMCCVCCGNVLLKVEYKCHLDQSFLV